MLLVGLLPSRVVRERIVPLLAIVTLAARSGSRSARFHHPASIISGALRIDDLALVLDLCSPSPAIAAVLLSWRGRAPR